MSDRTRKLREFRQEEDDDRIICRCEEITKGEIRKAVHEGMFTLTEIRRYLRTGMGLCQGQTCSKMVRQIVAKELQVSPGHFGAGYGESADADRWEMWVLAREGGEADV